MQADKRPHQDGVGDGRHKQHHAVECDRQRSEMVLAHPAGDKGHHRQPKQQMHVRPQHRAIHAMDGVQQVVVIVPVDGDVDEAEHVAEEDRPQFREAG